MKVIAMLLGLVALCVTSFCFDKYAPPHWYFLSRRSRTAVRAADGFFRRSVAEASWISAHIVARAPKSIVLWIAYDDFLGVRPQARKFYRVFPETKRVEELSMSERDEYGIKGWI